MSAQHKTTPLPTIHDVAQRAGVSAATVSRVMNNAPTVDPVLAARVQAAIDAMAYRPSSVARGLRTQRTQVWSLVISDIRNPFFTDLVRGVEDVALSAGYSLVLCNSDEDLDKERAYLDLIVRERMAGVILAAADSRRSDVSPLMAAGIPVVAIDRLVTSGNVDAVVGDNVAGATNAVTHLIEQGHTRIGLIGGPPTLSTGRERTAGYRKALKRAHIVRDPTLERIGDYKRDSGQRAALELVDLADAPTALFVANNLMTIGALSALATRGIRVPEMMAIVGFDDPDWASLLRPALTSVAQPMYQMGRTAAEILLRRMTDTTSPARVVTLQPELHVRASSPPLR